ncbi:MAG: phytanoyl-CoA dioxygenase family protein [Acidimicrobiales bacterium]|nr:phytanoyl-CoA dioxygenase family protein [Acidimicrobiales bacterium]
MMAGIATPPPAAGATALFLDPARQAEYDTQGYTTLPLLDPDEVQALLDGYAALVPEADEEHIAFDFTRDDRSVMDGVARLLKPLFGRKVPEHFVDHRAIFWTFVIKPAGPHSEMALHDDRTYVEEQHGRACTVWVPLVDTSPELDNGYLCVVPGSQTVLQAASGTNIANWFEPYDEYLKRHSVGVAVPAGTALIYDSKTLHWSPPNRSDAVRPAIAVAVVPAEAPLVHVVGEGLHRRRVYAVDEQFFVDFHPTLVEGGMPDGYELLREYDEARVSAAPEAVAAALGTDEIPVPTHEVTAPVPRVYRPGEGEGDDEVVEVTPDAPVPDRPDEGVSDEVAAPAVPPTLARRVKGKVKRLLAGS